jgi:hypothetical protein
VNPASRDRVLPRGWRASTDLAWTTSGDASGFHILTASLNTGYTWRTVATLTESGFDADQWIGNACMTSSGQRLVVVYAPRTFTNESALFDRGGFVAIVDIVTGAVTKLPIQGSLAYFSPGCGTGEQAVITQLNADKAQTRLITLDAAKRTLSKPVTAKGEVTSALPVSNGLIAAGARGLLRVNANGTLTRLAETSAVSHYLAADGDGGVVFLDRQDGQAVVRRVIPKPGAAAQTLATGKLGTLGVRRGVNGRVFLTGSPDHVAALPATVTRIDAPGDAEVSTLGQVAITQVNWASRRAARLAKDDPAAPRVVRIEAKVTATDEELTFDVEPGAPVEQAEQGRVTHPALNGAVAAAAGSPTNPADDDRWCSVPRNDPRNQAMQPKPRQVEWAVDQAVTDSLYVQREANWKNLGMPAYRPQDLFPPVPLLGGGQVPAQVMLGILAQESNLWQASSVAVPGVTANPLIGNFYGRPIYNTDEADDWDIHWDDADCGYGVAQVTDGMRLAGHQKTGEVPLPYDTQRAVALDFAANVAAGLRILQQKWNQTRANGLVVGDGDPSELENWFFAVWAYNSGFHPDQGNGSPWGVGWANNPINPRFDPDRPPFLETSYEDARTPQRWPYPEKVLGFAGHPPDLLEGPDQLVSAFRAAWWTTVDGRMRVKPPTDLFCTEENDCYPGVEYTPTAPDVVGEPAGPCAHMNSNAELDLQCWWHDPVTWKLPADTGHELLRFDPGWEYQADATSYTPRCDLLHLPEGALIIDDVADGIPSIRPGCGHPWTNAGSFSLQFAADATGQYPSKVDFHQIGGGFGGHFWFAHTRKAGDEGGKMKVTGTWTMSRQVNGWARVMVHIPDHGAHAQQAAYDINLGSGFANGKRRVILQRTQEHRWVSLGVFRFGGTPQVRLSTETYDGIGEEDIAWDAVAFDLLPGKPRHQIVSLGDSYSSGVGVSEDGGADYYRETDYKQIVNDQMRFQNLCLRSRWAWSRQAVLSDSLFTIGQRADVWDQNMDYNLLACNGAQTENLLPDKTVPPGQQRPENAFNESGKGAFGELSQLDKGFLDENTTLVTLSIGGNDSRFADVIAHCVYGTTDVCQNSTMDDDPEPLGQATAERISGPVKESIKTVLRQIHARAPNAKIMLMGYPKLFENLGSCFLGIGAAEAPWLAEMADLLAAKMGEAVADVRAEGIAAWFANPIGRFAGKGICGDPETIHGLVLTLLPGENGPLPDWLPESWNKFGKSIETCHPKIEGATIYAEVMNDVTRGSMGL